MYIYIELPTERKGRFYWVCVVYMWLCALWERGGGVGVYIIALFCGRIRGYQLRSWCVGDGKGGGGCLNGGKRIHFF